MLGTIVVYGDKQNLPANEQINVAANGVKEGDNSQLLSLQEREAVLTPREATLSFDGESCQLLIR